MVVPCQNYLQFCTNTRLIRHLKLPGLSAERVNIAAIKRRTIVLSVVLIVKNPFFYHGVRNMVVRGNNDLCTCKSSFNLFYNTLFSPAMSNFVFFLNYGINRH